VDEQARAPGLDDPETLARLTKEILERQVRELRLRRVPIATEPPTVFKP
jgi:hypothetical protein